MKTVVVNCQTCGKAFNVFPSRIKIGVVKYCSISCMHANPEYLDKRRAAIKKGWENPEIRANQIAAQTKAQGTPEARANNSMAQKKRWENPETRAKQSAVQKKAKGTIESRANNSAAQKKRYENPEERAKQSAALTRVWIEAQWFGTVKYYDGPIYCEKWTNELKERVRAFTGYVCFECGAPQNGKKLHVHHVWYNKRLCCDDTLAR